MSNLKVVKNRTSLSRLSIPSMSDNSFNEAGGSPKCLTASFTADPIKKLNFDMCDTTEDEEDCMNVSSSDGTTASSNPFQPNSLVKKIDFDLDDSEDEENKPVNTQENIVTSSTPNKFANPEHSEPNAVKSTPSDQMIPACTSRCPPVLPRKSFSSVSSSGPSPPKTRSGRIYKKRSLSPQPPSPTSTPRSAPPLHKRRPTPNNINLKLNLLQSDIRPSSDSPCYMKSRFQVETTSASDRSDQEESEALIKRRMELPQSLPELASPKLTAPPKLNAKLKRPVSRLSLQRWAPFKGDQMGSETPVRGIARLSPPASATKLSPDFETSPPTQSLRQLKLNCSRSPMSDSCTPDFASPKTMPRPPPRMLLDFDAEGQDSRRASLPSKLTTAKGDFLAGRKRKCAANVNPFTATPTIESLKRRKLQQQSTSETTPPDCPVPMGGESQTTPDNNGMSTPSGNFGRVLILDEVESPAPAPGKRIRVTDINISRYNEEFIELDEIASGEFGRVCVCRHRLDGMVYAIKMSKEEIHGQTHRERVVMNEVFAHSALMKHKHVVRYYNSWVENGRVYIQNEFCEGGSLAAKIKELRSLGKRFSESELRKIIVHVLKGLQYIHSKNLVHLDIKPENIFIALEHLSASSSPSVNGAPGEEAAQQLAADAAACAQEEPQPSTSAAAAKQHCPNNPQHSDSNGNSTDSGNVSSDVRFPSSMIHVMDESASYKIGDLGHVVSVEVGQTPEEGDCRYMAPELLMDKVSKPHLFKSDVFSLGLSLYEAASLVELPKNTLDSLDYETYKNGLLPPVEGYSKELNNIIKSMVNPDPMGRPSVARLISIMSRPPSGSMKMTKSRSQLCQELKEVKDRLRLLEEQLRTRNESSSAESDAEAPSTPTSADAHGERSTAPATPVTPPTSDDGGAKAGTCPMNLRKRKPLALPKSATPKHKRRGSGSLRKKALIKEATNGASR